MEQLETSYAAAAIVTPHSSWGALNEVSLPKLTNKLTNEVSEPPLLHRVEEGGGAGDLFVFHGLSRDPGRLR